MYDNIITFDIETTGLDPVNDKIIEFGALINGKTEVSILVNPGVPILNSNVHHITDEMVKDSITYDQFKELLQQLFVGKVLVIGYNVQFDASFVYNILGQATFDLLDVMAIYKDRHEYPWKLDNVVDRYCVETKNTHRALDDAIATHKCLLNMDPDLTKYINKIGYNIKYGV